jgi:hypothetical protein
MGLCLYYSFSEGGAAHHYTIEESQLLQLHDRYNNDV